MKIKTSRGLKSVRDLFLFRFYTIMNMVATMEKKLYKSDFRLRSVRR